jgi:type I restriction enzyme S subunit
MTKLPSDWHRDRLKDVALVNGASLPTNTDPDYEFDYLEISNVDYHGVINPDAIENLRFEDAPSRARRRVSRNCTLISSVRPNLQAVVFLSEISSNLVCSTGFNVVQPIENKVLPKFAYYALISERGRQYFEATATGVGYPAISDKDFGSHRLPLPTLPEQERIAGYLDASCAAIDAAIAAKRRQIETLDTTRESLIEHTVTRGVRVDAELRTIDNEWLTMIPIHWQACRIKRIVSSVDYGISQSTEPEGRYPVLKMGHIQRGEITFRNLDFVHTVPEHLLLDKGDLLFNRTNSPDQVGKAAIFRRSKADQVTFASYLVRLRTNHRADARYLNYLINCAGFLSFARKLAIPSVQQSNLNSTRYCRLLVPRPPLPEQIEIAAFLDKRTAELNRIVANVEAQIAALTTYRKSLIHECVTGQRRISEADLRAVTSRTARVDAEAQPEPTHA